jgi:hypothetical protein
VASAGDLTGPPAQALLTSARAAFVDGVGVTALAGAAVLVLVALTVIIGLRPALRGPSAAAAPSHPTDGTVVA